MSTAEACQCSGKRSVVHLGGWLMCPSRRGLSFFFKGAQTLSMSFHFGGWLHVFSWSHFLEVTVSLVEQDFFCLIYEATAETWARGVPMVSGDWMA